ncbi:type VI secretion system baseplate subunit TssG [Pantoea sp. B65]|uniref:type VI secretion system baseplate subunit TssG n=1 Tax=Pantoea sp. B65 TaxID=2813359 RepID=UPI0039B42D89
MNQVSTESESHGKRLRLAADFWSVLAAAPWRYDLFQLLRHIDARSGERYPLGRAPLPLHEPLRLGQLPAMAFAPSTLAQVSARATADDGGQLYDIAIYSFGLFGPNGPLPLHITEYVRERIYHYQDRSLTAFADLFHHRLILLFYRAWADAQPVVSLDRPDNHHFAHYIASLTGMGLPQQLNRGGLSTHARFAVAGHLSRHARDAEGLSKILRHYFAVPVRLVENLPHWLRIDRRDQARLASGRKVPRLGKNAFLGVAIRDVQHKFCIELGPMPLAAYQDFLPGQSATQQLCDWVKQYLGIEFIWQIRLLLDAGEVSGVVLGGAARLGFTSWLGQSATAQPRGDLIFSPEGAH